jgi:hypothetical protein
MGIAPIKSYATWLAFLAKKFRRTPNDAKLAES